VAEVFDRARNANHQIRVQSPTALTPDPLPCP
jgi:hypothetical protein